MDWFDFFTGMFIGAAICDEEYDDYYDEQQSYYESDEYEEMIFQKKLLEKIHNKEILLPEHKYKEF